MFISPFNLTHFARILFNISRLCTVYGWNLINCIQTKAPVSVGIGNLDSNYGPFLRNNQPHVPAGIFDNKGTPIHTHPTNTPIHIRLKLTHTIKGEDGIWKVDKVDHCDKRSNWRSYNSVEV